MPANSSLHDLFRSNTDEMIAGVCGGFAEWSGSPSWMWRAGFVMFTLLGGAGILAYGVLWYFMPKKPA